MKITVRKWTQKSEAVPSMGAYKTSVEIRDVGVLLGVTLNGHLTRKNAILQTVTHLHREGCWSPEFLRKIYNLATTRRKTAR